jgi:hypothetical protein
MKTSTFLTAMLLSGVLSSSAQSASVVQIANANQTLAASNAWLGNTGNAADELSEPFQFYHAAATASGSGTFSSTLAFATGTDFPQANYFFENHGNATHSIKSTAKLANHDVSPRLISEPASELLMLVALGALAIAVRRKMPESN